MTRNSCAGLFAVCLFWAFTSMGFSQTTLKCDLLWSRVGARTGKDVRVARLKEFALSCPTDRRAFQTNSNSHKRLTDDSAKSKSSRPRQHQMVSATPEPGGQFEMSNEASQSAAQELPSPVILRTRPQLTRLPTAEAKALYFPNNVQAGNVTVVCRLGLDERFRECHGTAEYPQGAGLGVAASKMVMAEDRAKPATIDGKSVANGLVSIQVRVASASSPTLSVPPSADATSQYFPERAERLGKGGAASVHCVIDRNGIAQFCTVNSEDPPDLGFGDAAVQLLEKNAQFTPQIRDGKPVDGGVIDVPVKFTLAN